MQISKRIMHEASIDASSELFRLNRQSLDELLLATLVEERPELLESPSLVSMLVRILRAMTDARPEEGEREQEQEQGQGQGQGAARRAGRPPLMAGTARPTVSSALEQDHSPVSARPSWCLPSMVVRLITRRTPGLVPVAQCIARQLSQSTMSP